jgi:hypothetical protein
MRSPSEWNNSEARIAGSQGPSVAIMQPLFVPWLGYFDLLSKVEVFVILDDVQLVRQSFQTRNRVLGSGTAPTWLSVPHVHASPVSDRTIAGTPIVEPSKAATRFDNILRQRYSSSPHLPEVTELVRSVVSSSRTIGECNIRLIRALLDGLKLRDNTVLSSDLSVAGRRSEKVLAILRELDWGTYIVGPTAVPYMAEDGVLSQFSDRVLIHRYEPARYIQAGHSDFTSHLSILDALLELGWQDTRSVVQQGRTTLTSFTHDLAALAGFSPVTW